MTSDYQVPQSLVDLIGPVTGEWTVGELAAYMDRHTTILEDGTEEWDGAVWPHGIWNADREEYICQVCRFAFPTADEPHDCEDSVWRDPNWAAIPVREWVLTNKRGS